MNYQNIWLIGAALLIGGGIWSYLTAHDVWAFVVGGIVWFCFMPTR